MQTQVSESGSVWLTPVKWHLQEPTEGRWGAFGAAANLYLNRGNLASPDSPRCSEISPWGHEQMKPRVARKDHREEENRKKGEKKKARY